MSEPERKSICRNRRARFQYEISDVLEAGLVLTGSEVKSLRDGRAHLNDAFAGLRKGEMWLHKAHIEPYPQANQQNHEPTRPRKLLLHRREIRRLEGKLRERGYTLIPLEMYWKDGRAKVELGLARGKKQHDKRHAIAKRESDLRLRRVTRRAQRGRS